MTSLASDTIQGQSLATAEILKMAGDVAYEWDLVTDQIKWFGAIAAFFPSGQAVSKGAGFLSMLHPEDFPVQRSTFTQHLRTHDVYECEFRIKRGDGYFWVQDRGAVEVNSDGTAIRFLGVLRGIDERKQIENAEWHSALFDSVTGQYNRSRLMDSVNEQLLYTRRYKSSACYLAVGIDYDIYGEDMRDEAVGDAILISVSQQIEVILRASDIIGRIGPREFGVLLTNCPPGHLDTVANKLLEKFEGAEVETVHGTVPIRMSIGGVTIPGCAQTGFDIMNNGESALAQIRHGDHFSFREFVWSPEQYAEYERCFPIGEKVLYALKEDRLQFAFQPIVYADTGKIAFYEALLRLWDVDDNLIAAKDFIPAAEQLGLCRVIDRRTLDLAIGELKRHPDIKLALNISGLTVADPGWLRRLTFQLQGGRDLAERLIIEITETMAMKDMVQSVQFVNRVRALGCKVALDDFGAGFTTFRHLKVLTVDIVKIDGAFVRDLTENRDNQLFIRTLLDMAHAFKLETVAEFVENAEVAAMLHAQGVNFLQGYHFGKPVFDPPFKIAASA
jgi:diguanylate cyclase (GGDEF)-like protein